MSRMLTTSGIVASRYGTSDRLTRATAAETRIRASIASGPVQPRTPNATSASANAMTSLVAGLRARYSPAGGRATKSGRRADESAVAEVRASVGRSGVHDPLTEREPRDDTGGQAGQD